MAESEREVLLARLARYPVDRYPVQHATTQFHLGSLLLHAGEVEAAVHALTAARDVFGGAVMRLEQAKATVMLGVAHRTAGERNEAVAAFSAACAELAALDQPADRAAASYNLGLVLADNGDVTSAQTAWTRARELFLAAGHPAQAAAAARDHGASLLTAGDAEAALPLLEQAMSLAERSGDETGVGLAANAVGLAHLAAHDPSAAVVALRRAVAAFPRTLRPAEHAMAKANLALAYEQSGDQERARLAGGQSLAVPSAAVPVRAQARQLLARLPGGADADLLAVLDREGREQWVPLIREEVLRVVELPRAQRGAMVRGFLDGVLARPATSYDLAQSLLEVVLELPPRAYELLVSAISTGSSDRPDSEKERLRAIIGSAMARFALPQWQRLAASLNAAAQASGEPATWS
ncbi:MAG: tetratricopeptide repeat protein [Nocardioidaceae bacterium]